MILIIEVLCTNALNFEMTLQYTIKHKQTTHNGKVGWAKDGKAPCCIDTGR